MAETSLVAARAAVYYYDAALNNWRPADDGVSRVDLYANNAAQSFRVVAISAKSNDVVINSPLYKDLKYQRASTLFHQWSDARFAYGLNFASLEEAESFASAVESATQKITVSAAPAPVPASRGRSGSTPRLAFVSRAKEEEEEQEERHRAHGNTICITAAPPPPEAPPVDDLQRKLAERRERAEGDPPVASPASSMQAPPRRPQMGSAGSAGSPAAKPPGALRLGSVTRTDLDAAKAELSLAFKREIEAMKKDVLEAVARVAIGAPFTPPPPVSPPHGQIPPPPRSTPTQAQIPPPVGPPPPL